MDKDFNCQQKGIAQIALVLLLLVGLGISVYLVQKNTNFFSRASNLKQTGEIDTLKYYLGIDGYASESHWTKELQGTFYAKNGQGQFIGRDTEFISRTIESSTNTIYYSKWQANEAFEIYRWDDNYIYLFQDHNGDVPYNTFSDNIWLKRKMMIGESINHDNNKITKHWGMVAGNLSWKCQDPTKQNEYYTQEECRKRAADPNQYDNGDLYCSLRSTDGEPGGVRDFPYKTTLENRIENFQNETGQLGSQDVIVVRYTYPPDTANQEVSRYEKFYFSKEWGWIRWEMYVQYRGQAYADEKASMIMYTVFNIIKNNQHTYPDRTKICPASNGISGTWDPLACRKMQLNLKWGAPCTDFGQAGAFPGSSWCSCALGCSQYNQRENKYNASTYPGCFAIPSVTVAPTPTPTPTPAQTPSCGSECTYYEIRKDAVEKSCKSSGMTCSSYPAFLTCHTGAAPGDSSPGKCTAWQSFGPSCKAPYCEPCQCGRAECIYLETNATSIKNSCDAERRKAGMPNCQTYPKSIKCHTGAKAGDTPGKCTAWQSFGSNNTAPYCEPCGCN